MKHKLNLQKIIKCNYEYRINIQVKWIQLRVVLTLKLKWNILELSFYSRVVDEPYMVNNRNKTQR